MSAKKMKNSCTKALGEYEVSCERTAVVKGDTYEAKFILSFSKDKSLIGKYDFEFGKWDYFNGYYMADFNKLNNYVKENKAFFAEKLATDVENYEVECFTGVINDEAVLTKLKEVVPSVSSVSYIRVINHIKGTDNVTLFIRSEIDEDKEPETAIYSYKKSKWEKIAYFTYSELENLESVLLDMKEQVYKVIDDSVNKE